MNIEEIKDKVENVIRDIRKIRSISPKQFYSIDSAIRMDTLGPFRDLNQNIFIPFRTSKK